MIKKIVLGSASSKSISTYRLQFCTKINGNWDILSPTLIDCTDSKIATFEEFTIESSKAVSAGSVANPCLFEGEYFRFVYYENTNTITVTFTEPLKVLKGIYYHFVDGYYTSLKIYDENDELIYEDDATNFSVGTTTITNSNYFYETSGLEVFKTYPVDTVGTVETNDNSHFTDIYQIESITTTQSVPTNTDLRYALSFDGRTTYKSYKSGLWTDVDATTIMTDGMTKDELEALGEVDYSVAITDTGTLDILVGMITTDSTVSPSISNITVDYLKLV